MYKVYYAQTYCKDNLGNESYSDITKFKIIYQNDYVEDDGSTQLKTEGSRIDGSIDEENILSDAQKEALENANKPSQIINYYYYYYGPQDSNLKDLAKEMELNQNTNNQASQNIQSNNSENVENNVNANNQVQESSQNNDNDDNVERAADGSPVLIQKIHAVPVDNLAGSEVGVITQSTNSDATLQTVGEIPAAGAPKTILIVLFVLNVVGLVFWKKSK